MLSYKPCTSLSLRSADGALNKKQKMINNKITIMDRFKEAIQLYT